MLRLLTYIQKIPRYSIGGQYTLYITSYYITAPARFFTDRGIGISSLASLKLKNRLVDKYKLIGGIVIYIRLLLSTQIFTSPLKYTVPPLSTLSIPPEEPRYRRLTNTQILFLFKKERRLILIQLQFFPVIIQQAIRRHGIYRTRATSELLIGRDEYTVYQKSFLLLVNTNSAYIKLVGDLLRLLIKPEEHFAYSALRQVRIRGHYTLRKSKLPYPGQQLPNQAAYTASNSRIQVVVEVEMAIIS